MLEILRRYRTAALVALHLIVAFALMFSDRRHPDGQLGPISGALFRVNTGAQAMLQAGVGGFGDAWDRYVRLVRVNEENDRLRAERDRLAEENARLLGVMQENARLRAMVGFMEGHPTLVLQPARVVAKEVSAFFRAISIRIDAGGGRVEVGMPVVSSAGVVGRISEVSGRYAQVMLAADPRSSIDVVVQRNRARGVIVGLGHTDDYSARVSYLLRRDAVEPGDVIVTSGLGGRFPPDLILGRIAAVEPGSAEMFQEVIVEPAVDYSRLEEVFVVTGQEETGGE